MDDCIFCKIIAGKSLSDFVYQGDKVVAFRNINPLAPTHIVIVPKRHVTTVTELEEQDRAAAAEMLMCVKKIAASEGVTETGFKLVINKGGPHVEMLVSHLHMHLLGGKELKGEI